MEEYVVVAVSPFYNGLGWTDAGTGKQFLPATSITGIRISKKKDLRGIQNSVRLGKLYLLEGNFDGVNALPIENTNPEELTTEQFKELIAKLKQEKPATDNGEAEKATEEAKAAKEAKTKAENALETVLSLHAFTAEELKTTSLTVDILKSIVEAKAIPMPEKETKANLKKAILGE